MLVQELASGTVVSVESSDNDARVNLKTYIAEITAPEDKEIIQRIRKEKKSAFCILHPIYEEEKLLNFASDYVASNLVYVEDNKPYIFEKVQIVNWKLPVYGSVHIVFSTRKAITYNRRQHFRLWLGCDGFVVPVGEEKIRSCIIKDVSEGGIAFITRETENLGKGTVVETNFTDSASSKTFKMSAVIIRSEELPDGRTIFGCRLTNFNDALAHFINEKQQEHLRSGKKGPISGGAE